MASKAVTIEGTVSSPPVAYEVRACPLVLAQNERELTHTCADEAYGVTSLGLGARLSDDQVANALRALLAHAPRAEARRRMAGVDLWSGPDRIMTAILGLLRARRLRDRALRAFVDTL